MKRISLSMLFPLALVLTTTVAYGQTPQDEPEIAQRETLRRGDLVEQFGSAFREGGQELFTAAMETPADDSHKWFISVVSMQNCRNCELLKRDFAKSPDLKAFADISDKTQSWSHYSVYQIEDETQSARWKNLKLRAFPALLVQPPRSGEFGDAKTVVLQVNGYDGDTKKLADILRRGIAGYVNQYAEQQPVIRQAENIVPSKN